MLKLSLKGIAVTVLPLHTVLTGVKKSLKIDWKSLYLLGYSGLLLFIHNIQFRIVRYTNMDSTVYSFG